MRINAILANLKQLFHKMMPSSQHFDVLGLCAYFPPKIYSPLNKMSLSCPLFTLPIETEQVYYSYGTAAGDTTFDATSGVANIDGYTVSGPIPRMQLLPIGEQLFQYIYVSTSALYYASLLMHDVNHFSVICYLRMFLEGQ